MATETNKTRQVKYFNRDFSSLKKDIIEYTKTYFPDTYSNFNESSVGQMLVEQMCFVGDILSFYMDKKFDESFIESCKEKRNLFKRIAVLKCHTYEYKLL